MIYNNLERLAFNATKEIVVARMSNAKHDINEASGKNVGDYFQAIYDKIREITASSDSE